MTLKPLTNDGGECIKVTITLHTEDKSAVNIN